MKHVLIAAMIAILIGTMQAVSIPAGGWNPVQAPKAGPALAWACTFTGA